MKVSECAHRDFKIDFVKDGVSHDFALFKRKRCGLEFAFLLDADGKGHEILGEVNRTKATNHQQRRSLCN